MIIVLLLITIVGSVLVTWLLPMAFKSEPPYGVVVDIGVGTALAVAWALLAFLVILPALGLRGGALALALNAGDAVGFAAVMLWILRRVKG